MNLVVCLELFFLNPGAKKEKKSRAKRPINIQAVAMTALVWRQSEDVTSTKPQSGINPDVHPTVPKFSQQFCTSDTAKPSVNKAAPTPQTRIPSPHQDQDEASPAGVVSQW